MDLSVDGTLDDTNADLKMINKEFDDIEANAPNAPAIWGQSDLASAMWDFADNWWVHRGKIQDRLKALSGKVDSACTTWDDAEKQLSQSIETTH